MVARTDAEVLSSADSLVRAAVALFQEGSAAAAEAKCREALTLAPEHHDASNMLGLVLHFDGRHGEAETLFAELADREPQEPAHWINLGTARRCAKRYDEALAAYTRAAELGAASAGFFCNVGLTHLDRCDFEAARAVLARAMELAPGDAEIRYRYAFACNECQRTEDAIRALEDWESIAGLGSELIANIGFLLMNLGESARSELALKQAALDPAPDLHVTLTLVQAFERTNRVAEARALLDALATHPRADVLGDQLLLTQAQLAQREGQHEMACRLFEQALRRNPQRTLRQFQLFPLAKSLDALGRYDEAFDAALEAHRSQAGHLATTSPAALLRGIPTMAITRFKCDASDVASWDHSGAPDVAASPIFIVAFPRSGTTLLELTLDAHPLLRSMDEQPFLQNALDELRGQGVSYPNELGRLSPSQVESVRAAYWQRARRKTGLEDGQRLIDKNPLNILRLPVIHRLFPNARIVLAIRHPCDVLLSCFMQHFGAPDFALLCSDLRALAHGYRRAFDYWYEQAQLLAPRVHEVRYENFVEHFDTEIRALADFLELPWDDHMLAPAEHARGRGFISTPSYAQVVQPLYRKSMGRWKNYERHFSAVLPALRPYLDRWSYEG